MRDMPTAYILLSGGIDSTTALWRASHEGYHDIRCISFDYGQRHRRELNSAAAIAFKLNLPHETLPVKIPRTMLTDPSIEVPSISYAEIEGVSPTYVPFRNGLLLSTLASHIAGVHLDPSRRDMPDYDRDCVIFWGAHAEDAAGDAYPDCTPEFIGAMACALYVGTYRKVRLITPFAAMHKHEIIAEGARYGVPYQTTWSCYRGGAMHCGECATCRARRDAFRLSGVPDPTVYAVQGNRERHASERPDSA